MANFFHEKPKKKREKKAKAAAVKENRNVSVGIIGHLSDVPSSVDDGCHFYFLPHACLKHPTHPSFSLSLSVFSTARLFLNALLLLRSRAKKKQRGEECVCGASCCLFQQTLIKHTTRPQSFRFFLLTETLSRSIIIIIIITLHFLFPC